LAFRPLARILHYLPVMRISCGIWAVLHLSLTGAHAFDLLHPAARAARALGKAFHALG